MSAMGCNKSGRELLWIDKKDKPKLLFWQYSILKIYHDSVHFELAVMGA